MVPSAKGSGGRLRNEFLSVRQPIDVVVEKDAPSVSTHARNKAFRQAKAMFTDSGLGNGL
jgi:hypothetical protein